MSNDKLIENLIIIGSGPAAFSAALYTQHLNPILFEGSFEFGIPGGQLMTTTDVDNYPGFPNGITGPDLIKAMKSQLKIRMFQEQVISIEKINGNGNKNNCEIDIKTDQFDLNEMPNNYFKIVTDEGEYYSLALIVATGSLAKRLYVPGCDEFWQRGISACAICDGWAYKDKTVIVIGGGDTAMEEAKHLSGIAKKVILVHRSDNFKARKDFFGRILNTPNIEIKTNYVLETVQGTEYMEATYFRNTVDKKLLKVEADGLFFGIGHEPNSKFLSGIAELDDSGYLICQNGRTSCEGIFGCGDIQDKKYKQAITAAGSGCVAGLEAVKYLNEKYKLKEK